MRAIDSIRIGTTKNAIPAELACPVGKRGHLDFADLTETPPVSDREAVSIMEQWCLPSRRQQAGRLLCESAEVTDGISGRLMTTSKPSAMARSNPLNTTSVQVFTLATFSFVALGPGSGHLNVLLKFADSHYARKVRIRLISLMLLSVFNGTAADLPEERREAASTPDMRVHIVRLRPGEDLLAGIQAYVKRHNFQAGILLTTVGSLQETRLRLANRPGATSFKGKVEIVSLVGTIDAGSAHLHLSVSDRNGRTMGGHLVGGCKIYTTAEIAIGELSGVRFSREMDRESGYEELKVSPIR